MAVLGSHDELEIIKCLALHYRVVEQVGPTRQYAHILYHGPARAPAIN